MKNMASWEPVDIDPTDRDETGEENYKWDNDVMNDLEIILNPIRTEGGRGVFHQARGFFANDFGSNKATHSNLCDFS